jgi:hypothetical protein
MWVSYVPQQLIYSLYRCLTSAILYLFLTHILNVRSLGRMKEANYNILKCIENCFLLNSHGEYFHIALWNTHYAWSHTKSRNIDLILKSCDYH